MYGCMDVWMYGCMDVCMYVCMYVYIHTYAYIYIIIYIYIYTHMECWTQDVRSTAAIGTRMVRRRMLVAPGSSG